MKKLHPLSGTWYALVQKILHSVQCINEKIQDSKAGLLECRKINCDWGSGLV